MKSAETPLISRREARRLDKREAILAVAEKSFLRDGYVGTTMSSIAAELGGSKGTLWSYFPSKEELFAAVFDRATRVFRERLAESLDNSTDDLAAVLRHVCNGFLCQLASQTGGALHRLVIGEAGRFPEVGQVFHNRVAGGTRSLFAGFLTTAMDRGQLRRDDGERAARALMALCLAGCYQQLLVGMLTSAPREMIEADVSFAVDMFMRAYAPGPDGPPRE